VYGKIKVNKGLCNW